MLTTEELKPFAIASIEKKLRAITKSKKYYVKANRYNIEVCFETKKYLYPYDKQQGRNYTTLNHYTSYNRYEIVPLVHALILCKQLKTERDMPLHAFIREVIHFTGMCVSMLAYYTDEKVFTSRDLYDLPESTKRKIYEYMKTNIKNINTNVYTDSEGCSYNSIELKEAI